MSLYKKNLFNIDDDLHDIGYFKRVGGVLSRVANVLFLNGYPAESISGRSHRAYLERSNSTGRRNLVKFINALFFLDKDHCKKAYLEDIRYANVRIEKHEKLMKHKNIDNDIVIKPVNEK